MKHISLYIFCILIAGLAQAQNVVTWKFSAKKTADKTYEIHMTATVEEPWHIYSQSTPKGGPLPTSFSFGKNPLVIMQGKVDEKGSLEIYHDEIFDVDVYSFTGEADFVQIVKLKNNVKTNIGGTVEFMACTKRQCLTPQKVKFTIKLD